MKYIYLCLIFLMHGQSGHGAVMLAYADDPFASTFDLEGLPVVESEAEPSGFKVSSLETYAELSLEPEVVGTLNAPSIDSLDTVSYNQWLASSFSGDEGAPSMKVLNVSMKMEIVVPNQFVFVGITSSASQRPNMEDVLVTMDISPLQNAAPGTVSTISLSPLANVGNQLLVAGNDYWLVFGVSALDNDQDAAEGGLYRWSYAATSGPYDSVDGWGVKSLVATGNSVGQAWTPDALEPYSFSVSLAPVIDPIPEPQTTVLILLSILLIHSRRRYSS